MASAYEWRVRPVSFPLDSFGFRKIFIDSIQYWCLSVNVRVYSFVGSPDFQATLPLRRSLVRNDVIYGMQPMVVRGINSNVVRAFHHGSGVSYLSRPLVRSDVISGMKPMARQELGSILFCASMFSFFSRSRVKCVSSDANEPISPFVFDSDRLPRRRLAVGTRVPAWTAEPRRLCQHDGYGGRVRRHRQPAARHPLDQTRRQRRHRRARSATGKGVKTRNTGHSDGVGASVARFNEKANRNEGNDSGPTRTLLSAGCGAIGYSMDAPVRLLLLLYSWKTKTTTTATTERKRRTHLFQSASSHWNLIVAGGLGRAFVLKLSFLFSATWPVPSRDSISLSSDG